MSDDSDDEAVVFVITYMQQSMNFVTEPMDVKPVDLKPIDVKPIELGNGSGQKDDGEDDHNAIKTEELDNIKTEI